MKPDNQSETISLALFTLLTFFSKLPFHGPIDERSCIILRMLHVEGKSYEEVGKAVGLTVIRIQQLEARALKKLSQENLNDFLSFLQKRLK